MPLRLTPGFGYPYASPGFRRGADGPDRAFGGCHRDRGATSEFPPINVWSGEHDVVISAEVAGVDPDDIEVTVDGAVLTLKGRRPQPEFAENAAAHRRERSYGAFARSLTLSFEPDTEKVQADCHDGILRIYLPRPEAEKPRRIRIATT